MPSRIPSVRPVALASLSLLARSAAQALLALALPPAVVSFITLRFATIRSAGPSTSSAASPSEVVVSAAAATVSAMASVSSSLPSGVHRITSAAGGL